VFSSESARLLAELRSAHSRLLDAIYELEQLSCGAKPSQEYLSLARSKLSKVSIERRLLWARILGHLAPVVGRKTEADLRVLQDSDIALLKNSVKHASKWKIPNAITEWRTFGHESRRLLHQLTAHVKLEKQTSLSDTGRA
jgi:hypothetical protein